METHAPTRAARRHSATTAHLSLKTEPVQGTLMTTNKTKLAKQASVTLEHTRARPPHAPRHDLPTLTLITPTHAMARMGGARHARRAPASREEAPISRRVCSRPGMCAVLSMLLALLAAPAVALGQETREPVRLQPQWEEGQTSRYEIFTRREQRGLVMAAGERREQQASVETTGELTWHVQQVRSDGGAVCEMTIDWMRMTMRSDQAEQVNDSRQGSGDTEPVHDMLRAMAGTPIEVRVAPDGLIEGVAGVDAVRQSMANPGLAPGELDLIESASKLALLAGAPAQATVGDTWQRRNRWRHEMGYLHEDITWRLEGVEHIAGIPVATVTGDAVLDLEFEEPDMPPDAPPVDVRLREGDLQTQVMFDLQRGEAVGRNSVQHTRIEITVETPQQRVQQEIEQTIQSQALRIGEE